MNQHKVTLCRHSFYFQTNGNSLIARVGMTNKSYLAKNYFLMKSLSALLLSAVICFSFPSCQYMDIRNAVKFNDSIIKINQAIMSNAKIWGDSYGQATIPA